MLGAMPCWSLNILNMSLHLLDLILDLLDLSLNLHSDKALSQTLIFRKASPRGRYAAAMLWSNRPCLGFGV